MALTLMALILSAAVLVVVYIINWMRFRYNYWRSLGIRQAPGVIPPFGHTLPIATFRKSLGEHYKDLYFRFPGEPAVGAYDFVRPILVLRDPRLIEKVLVKDFGHFVDRGFSDTIDEKANPIDLALFTLAGNRWRAVRQKLVPTFTTGKLKKMHGGMTQCADNMVAWIQKQENEEVEIRKALGMFTTDVIGSCVFGMDLGEHSEPDSKFKRMSQQLLTLDFKQMIKFLIITNIPSLAKKIKLSFNNQEVVEYFSAIVQKAFDERAGNPKAAEDKKDFLQLLMELKRKGVVELVSKDMDEEDDYLKMDGGSVAVEKIELTDELLFAQAFQFLTAGLEGTALVAMYLVHELGQNQDVQDRLRSEIQDVLQESAEGLTYEAVKKMTYLHQCLLETMRKYPTAMILFRECQKEYRAEELGGVGIKAGTQVIVPIWALHYDPDYFPEPEVFRPERFAEGEESTRPNCVYLPFGDGPRMCIGMRFAMLEMKVAVIQMVKRYKIQPSQNTRVPLEFTKTDFLLSPLKPVFVKLVKIAGQ